MHYAVAWPREKVERLFEASIREMVRDSSRKHRWLLLQGAFHLETEVRLRIDLTEMRESDESKGVPVDNGERRANVNF